MSELYFTITESKDKDSYVVEFIDATMPSFSVLKSRVIVVGDTVPALTKEVVRMMEVAKQKREAELAVEIANEIMVLMGKGR
jgi:hypothetical protein